MNLKELVLDVVPSRNELPKDTRDIRIAVFQRCHELDPGLRGQIDRQPRLVDEALYELERERLVMRTSDSKREPARIGQPLRGRIQFNPRGVNGIGTVQVIHGFVKVRS